jgi:hypothetical protein
MLLRRVLAILLLCVPCGARASEVWMAALDPHWRSVMHLPPTDFMELFRPDSPWSGVAAHLTEFRLSKRFVLEATDDELATVVRDLTRRHINIAMQITPLLHTKLCGLGVEGYGPKEDAGHAAERIRDAGGALDAVVMDEPLYYGHFFEGRPGHPACRAPISELARQAATKIAQVRAVFPRVRVGEVEPLVGAIPTHDFQEALVTWLANLTLMTGRPLAFIQADVLWGKPGWQDRLTAFSGLAANQNLPLGVIYNGGRPDKSDAAWTGAARRHYHDVETRLGLTPDIVAFENWTPFPEHLLPETQDDTLTGLVLGYLRFRKMVK